jgi:hypothetical protein
MYATVSALVIAAIVVAILSIEDHRQDHAAESDTANDVAMLEQGRTPRLKGDFPSFSTGLANPPVTPPYLIFFARVAESTSSRQPTVLNYASSLDDCNLCKEDVGNSNF